MLQSRNRIFAYSILIQHLQYDSEAMLSYKK